MHLNAQQMIEDLFKKLGLTDKEYLVFVTLYTLGVNPASVVASHCGIERTTTYRNLSRLNKLGLVSKAVKNNMQMFFVEDEKVLLKFIKNKRRELEKIEDDYTIIQSELKSLRKENFTPPKIKIYDSSQHDCRHIFLDILDEIDRQELRSIRLIASNTFSEQVGKFQLKDLAKNFLKDLEKNNINLDTLIAEGNLIRERLKYSDNYDVLSSLPATNGASNIYIVGNSVFIIIFKENVVALKISHDDIAQTLHFIFDNLKGNI